MNLGLHWEGQRLFNSERKVAVDITDNWAPRLGFTWDYKGDGSSKLYGSWGRFYETIPADIIIRSFGNEIIAFTYNLHGDFDDPNRLDVASDPWVNENLRGNSILGGDTPVDPNLKGQYVDELVLGTDVQVSTDWFVGGKYIYRNLGRVIEDGLQADLNYQIGNPGEGNFKTTYDSDCNCYAFPVPKAERTFTGVEVTVKKRFANNWQLMASYLWSKLEGNYDGTFQASTGQLDPNINSAYDYAEFQINNDGPLTNDRRHQVKIDASYTTPFNLTIGASAYWRSGVPITAYGYSFAYENWEFYLSRRGEFGTTDDEYEASLHLGYPIKLGSGIELNLLADVFNLLDRQGETNRNMQYDLNEEYEVLNYDDGSVLPPIRKGVTDRPPTNPSFNKANAWQAPRAIRIGARLSF